MRSSIYILLLLIIGSACEQMEEGTTKVFIIKAGEHYATPRVVESLKTDALHFKARFNNSAIYTFDDQSLQDSKNKLMGFSDCNSTHHTNSARFTWQWYNGQLEIYAYCYVDSERVEQYIGAVKIDTFNEYTLSVTAGEYIFKLNDQPEVHINRTNPCTEGGNYILWPYFGGTLPAPHEVSIEIQRL